jgi:hypothetical protein
VSSASYLFDGARQLQAEEGREEEEGQARRSAEAQERMCELPLGPAERARRCSLARAPAGFDIKAKRGAIKRDNAAKDRITKAIVQRIEETMASRASSDGMGLKIIAPPDQGNAALSAARHAPDARGSLAGGRTNKPGKNSAPIVRSKGINKKSPRSLVGKRR